MKGEREKKIKAHASDKMYKSISDNCKTQFIIQDFILFSLFYPSSDISL